MYNTQYAGAIRSNCRNWRSRLVFGQFTLYGIESVSFANGSQSGNNITVGSVVAPSVSVVLTSLTDSEDVAHELTGLEFTWELGILKDIDDFNGRNDDSDFEFIPIGQFKVTNVKKDGTRYNIECSHKLSQADVTHISALSFPTTAQVLMQEVVNSLGLTFSQTLSPSISIEGIPEGATKRDIMGWIGALYGSFVCADRADHVLIKWYEDSSYTLPADALASPEIAEQDIEYTAVSCIVDTDTTFTIGSGRAMTFECPFMTAAQFETVAQSLIGFTYRPIKAEMLLGDPLLDPWDIVNLRYDGTNHILPAASLMLEHKGGVSSSIEAKGEETASISRVDPITRAVSRLVKLINENKSEIEQDIADAIAQATALIRGGSNGYFYIIDDNGINRETIWSDNADPAQATHGIRINKNGIGFWVKDPTDPDSSLFNGPYTQAWTIDGTLIADFIKAGTLSGITIVCENGNIGGWDITPQALVSPDELVRLESTYIQPLMTHRELRELGYTHNDLRSLTHRQIRYLRSRTTGKAQISAQKDMDIAYLRDGAFEVERSGNRAFHAGADSIDLYTDNASAHAHLNNGTLEISVGGGGGFRWWAGGRVAFIYDATEKLFRLLGEVSCGNFTSGGTVTCRALTVSGGVECGDVSCGKIDSTMLGVVGRYGILDAGDSIEKHGGLNIYDPDKTYLGGIRAAEISGDHGIAASVSLTNADFVGLWAQYDRTYSDLIAMWDNATDEITIGKTTTIDGDLLITGDAELTGGFFDAPGYNVKTSGTIVGEVGTLGTANCLDMRCTNGDGIRWLVGMGSYSAVFRYDAGGDELHVHRDMDMHNFDLIDANIVSSSDERLKANITDSKVECLPLIDALRLIEFDWKDGRHEDIGFSAQQAGSVREDLQAKNGEYLAVNEGRLIRYLVGAVQELSAEVKRLKEKE